jgi:hypothetical protein
MLHTCLSTSASQNTNQVLKAFRGHQHVFMILVRDLSWFCCWFSYYEVNKKFWSLPTYLLCNPVLENILPNHSLFVRQIMEENIDITPTNITHCVAHYLHCEGEYSCLKGYQIAAPTKPCNWRLKTRLVNSSQLNYLLNWLVGKGKLSTCQLLDMFPFQTNRLNYIYERGHGWRPEMLNWLPNN